tara:strand:- start:2316 stop:2465 length:150 start_codon:yes stop_codon:yes gene_type:complete
MENLAQKELEELSPEQFSYFLGHGETEEKEIQKELAYESYLKSHRQFDL